MLNFRFNSVVSFYFHFISSVTFFFSHVKVSHSQAARSACNRDGKLDWRRKKVFVNQEDILCGALHKLTCALALMPFAVNICTANRFARRAEMFKWKMHYRRKKEEEEKNDRAVQWCWWRQQQRWQQHNCKCIWFLFCFVRAINETECKIVKHLNMAWWSICFTLFLRLPWFFVLHFSSLRNRNFYFSSLTFTLNGAQWLDQHIKCVTTKTGGQ